MFRKAKMVHFKDFTNDPKNCWKEKYLGIYGDMRIHCSNSGHWIELFPYLPCPAKGINEWFHTSTGYLKKDEEIKQVELVTNHSVFVFKYEKEEENI